MLSDRKRALEFRRLLEALGKVCRQPQVEHGQAIRIYCRAIRDYLGATEPETIPVLESVDVRILELLSQRPGVSHSQYDLREAGDRKTIGQRLRHLRIVGYVAHPCGKKRGNVITPEGLVRLESLAETSP